MNTDTFGITLHERDEHGPQRFDGFISISVTLDKDPSSSEFTLVTISKYSLTSRSRLARVLVEHPAGVILDADNWAGYLYHTLLHENKIRRWGRSSLGLMDCESISTHLSFGYYYFEIEQVSNLFGILVDRPEGTVRTQRTLSGEGVNKPGVATIIRTPYDSKWDNGRVFYNDKGIYFNRAATSRLGPVDPKIYSIPFKRDLSNTEIAKIYVEGFQSLDLRTIFDTKGAGDYDLHFHDWFGFEYFISGDRQVIFTLQDQAIVRAFMAIDKQIEVLPDGENMFTLKNQNALFKEYAYNGGKNILPKIFDLIDQVNHSS